MGGHDEWTKRLSDAIKTTSPVEVGYIDEGNRGFTTLLKHGSLLKTPLWCSEQCCPSPTVCNGTQAGCSGGESILFSQYYSLIDGNEILTISYCEVAI